MKNDDNIWHTTHDHLAKFMFGFCKSKSILIPEGTPYPLTEWCTKEKTEVDQPNKVELVSFANDNFFGRWTR